MVHLVAFFAAIGAWVCMTYLCQFIGYLLLKLDSKIRKHNAIKRHEAWLNDPVAQKSLAEQRALIDKAIAENKVNKDS